MPFFVCCFQFGKSSKLETDGVSRNGKYNPSYDSAAEEENKTKQMEELKSRVTAYESELAQMKKNMAEVERSRDELGKDLKNKSVKLEKAQQAMRELKYTLQKTKEQQMCVNAERNEEQKDKRIAELTATLRAIMPDQSRKSAKRRHAVFQARHFPDQAPEEVKKSEKDQSFLFQILRNHELLHHISNEQLTHMVSYMKQEVYGPGGTIFKQGEDGDGLYILESGECKAFKNGNHVLTISDERVIGEIAILYKCKRVATLIATSSVTAWYLERSTYQYIMERSGRDWIKEFRKLVQRTPLRNLSIKTLGKIADAGNEEEFNRGTYIIRQGEIGRTFFIIKKGEVDITQTKDAADGGEEKLLKVLSSGSCFGEKAFQTNGCRRTASVIAKSEKVTCFTLDKKDFERLIGNMNLQNMRDTLSPPTLDVSRKFLPLSNHKPTYDSLQLAELESVVCLGAGAFGRVDLVRVPRLRMVFALKKIKKHVLVERDEQEQVIQEKKIMMECRCNFIVGMFRTFKDERCVYMLMEACLGGELWTVLQQKKRFLNNRARFYASCVIEALDYLQRKKVVHRDLKLENLLLNEKGFLLLADFGYAKVLEPGEKTWTFCGTPHYMAPEIVRSLGYDIAVDYWALGVLIFELLTGSPPFDAESENSIYKLTSRGIGGVNFPNYVSPSAKDLIRRLCREKATSRLGNLKNGIADIRNHTWFNGFDWEGLRSGSLTPEYVPKVVDGLDTRNFPHAAINYETNDDIPIEICDWDENF